MFTYLLKAQWPRVRCQWRIGWVRDNSWSWSPQCTQSHNLNEVSTTRNVNPGILMGDQQKSTKTLIVTRKQTWVLLDRTWRLLFLIKQRINSYETFFSYLVLFVENCQKSSIDLVSDDLLSGDRVTWCMSLPIMARH